MPQCELLANGWVKLPFKEKGIAGRGTNLDITCSLQGEDSEMCPKMHQLNSCIYESRPWEKGLIRDRRVNVDNN